MARGFFFFLAVLLLCASCDIGRRNRSNNSTATTYNQIAQKRCRGGAFLNVYRKHPVTDYYASAKPGEPVIISGYLPQSSNICINNAGFNFRCEGIVSPNENAFACRSGHIRLNRAIAYQTQGSHQGYQNVYQQGVYAPQPHYGTTGYIQQFSINGGQVHLIGQKRFGLDRLSFVAAQNQSPPNCWGPATRFISYECPH